MNKVTLQEVEAKYPSLYVASIEDKKSNLDDFEGSDKELEEFTKDYLQSFWSIGDFVFLNVRADRGRFNEPILALHTPSGAIVRVVEAHAKEGEGDLYNEFWSVYANE